MRAEIKKPETFEAPSNVLNAAPIARKQAVMHMVTAKRTAQKVKKAAAVVFKPTMKYSTTEKMLIWNRRIGMSAAIWAMQNAPG